LGLTEFNYDSSLFSGEITPRFRTGVPSDWQSFELRMGTGPALNGLFRLAARLPFTILLLLGLTVAGWWTNSHLGPLEATHRQWFGSSLQKMLDGEFLHVFTSLFLTAGGWHFAATVLMSAACVGWSERVHGTLRTVLVFFGVHVITLAVVNFVCLLPLASFKLAFAEALLDSSDVGPSAGYYGCLGFALATTRRNFKWSLGVPVFGILTARLILSSLAVNEAPHFVIGDVTHLIAFPLGLMAQWLFSGKSRSGAAPD
jgi:membrane associated rhomboid family serine protease